MKTLEDINRNYTLEIIDFFVNEYSKVNYSGQKIELLLSDVRHKLANQIENRLFLKGLIYEFNLLTESCDKSDLRDSIISTVLGDDVDDRVIGTITVYIRVSKTSDIVQRRYNIVIADLLK